MLKRVVSLILIICMLAPSVLNVRAVETGELVSNVMSESKFEAEAHDAQAKKKDGASRTSVPNLQGVRNEYIEFYVSGTNNPNSGRFTIGNVEGNPKDSMDNGKILLYGHGDPWSSYTTIRINDENYIFCADETEYNAEAMETVSTMTIDQIVVQQTLKIVENSVTGLKDTVQISYSIQNNSGTVQNIGVRIMMDTMLGSNDGAPFKVPSVGNVTQELQLIGNEIPATWQATDSLTNPSVFSVGTLFRSGERMPDKVQFASWNQIYESANVWDYTISPDLTVTGDSAVGIYWNPQSVAAGDSTTVKTYYGVGYTDIVAEESTIDIPTKGFAILVVDANSNPVSGATVEAINISGNPKVTTDENGCAVFNILPSGTGNMRTVQVNVTKDGYLDTMNVNREVTKGGFAAVSIYPDDGSIHVLAVNGTINGTSVDLLSKNKFFKSNASSVEEADDGSNVKNFVLQIEAASSESISKYQLIQGGQVVMESTTNRITIPVLTGTPADPDSFGSDWRITKLDAGKTVYLRVLDNNGKSSNRIPLGIKVSEPTLYGFSETKGSLKFGEKLKINVPSEIPILGDTEIELGWNGLPFEFEIFEDGKVKFAINADLAKYGSGVVDGTSLDNWDEVEKHYADAMEQVTMGRSGAAKAFGSHAQKFGAGCIDLDFNVMGYGEGYVDDGGNLHVNVGLVMKVTQEGSYTWTFFLGYVPVYISVGEKLSLSGSGEINILATDGNLSVSGAVGEINPKITLNVDGGVGANGVLNIGTSGRATLSWLNRWTDGYNKVTLNGSMYIVAQAFLFKAEKKMLDGTWTIYDNYRSPLALQSTDNYSSPLALQSTDNFSIYNSAEYQPIDRSYLNAVMPRSVGSSDVRTYVYPDASPTLVQVGNTAYLFWLEDIASRADNDRTALVYAKSADMKNWSDPVQIIPETETSTADYAYSVCVDGTDIHIVISKANCRFEDQEVTIDDLAAAAEIYYTKLNTLTDTVSDAVCVTENAYSDTMPGIAVSGDEIVVVYAENHMEGGLFGVDNTYRVCCSVIGGETSGYDTEGPVVDLAAGQFNDSCFVSYIIDTDRNLDTSEDTKLWIISEGSQTQVENSGTGVSSVSFAKMGNQDVLLWYADEGIYRLNEDGIGASALFEEGTVCPVGKAFQTINDAEGNLNLIWERMSRDETSDYTTIHAISWNGDIWSNPYVLFETDNEVTSVLSGYSDGDVSYIARLKTWGLEDETQYTSLCVETINPESDAELVGIDYAPEDVVPGEALPMTLTICNNGSKQIDTISVTADQEEIFVIENAALGCGEVKQYTVEGYTVDAALSAVQTVSIGIAVENDTDNGNNNQTIAIGYVDIQVSCNQMIVNQEDWLNISVSNERSIAANTIVRVFADEESGAILYERTITKVNKDSSESILLNLNELDPMKSIDVFYITVEAAENETVIFNNATSVDMSKCREKTYSLIVTAENGGNISSSIGGSYPEYAVLDISADADKGYVFSHWTSSNGGTFGDPNAVSTTFTMPGNDVEIQAVFAELVHEHVFTQYYSDKNATCTQDGTKTAECDLCRTTNTIIDEGSMREHEFHDNYCSECGLDYPMYVHTPETLLIDTSLYPESGHDYECNLDDIQTLTYEGAYSLKLTFSSDTATESGYDEVILYDGEDNQLARYSGGQFAGQSITIPGDTVKVRFITDGSVTSYGYSFSSITAILITHDITEYTSDGNATCSQDGTKSAVCPTCGCVDVLPDVGSRLEHIFENRVCTLCDLNYALFVHEPESVQVDASLYPESQHDYGNNMDDTQVFTYEDAYTLEITFSDSTKTESGFDKIWLYDGEDNQIGLYTDSDLAGQTVLIPGNTVKIRLTSDGSVTSYGYSFSSISAVMVTHNLIIEEATVTCTEGGLSEGRYCADCGEVLAVQKAVPATGHDYKAGVCTACGDMDTGKWVKSGTKWYYVDGDGNRAVSQWMKLSGYWYHFDADGYMDANKWVQSGDKWYYVNASGVMQTGWVKVGNDWYYMDTDGAMQTGWVKVGNDWYYLNSGGAMQTGWVKIGNDWYYLNFGGAMQTGWVKVGNDWYYLHSNGAMATGWVKVGNDWYYLNSGGAMQTGWLQLDGKWYYLKPDGAMATGKHWINNRYYTFTASGVWVN